SQEAKRRELEQITHPRIGPLMWQRANEAFEGGHPWVLYDAALLVEHDIHEMLDSLVVVSVSAETQLQRLMARDAVGRDDAMARIAAQLPLASKVAAADYVIDNDGALERTRARVAEVYALIDESVRARGTAKPPGVGRDT
ncbi:MAG: dephospho-CoA kinase, partial [Myxococcota bacterium]